MAHLRWRICIFVFVLILDSFFAYRMRRERELRSGHFTSKLPKCKLYEDTFGTWKSVREVTKSAMSLREFEQAHFFGVDGLGNGAGHALEFDKIWVPNNCSYHRFTNETINKCLLYDLNVRSMNGNLSQEAKTKPFEIVFMGDSAMRGIVCGISRILLGDEIRGPLGNVICGFYRINPLSTSALGHPYTWYVNQGSKTALDLTFTYIKTFQIAHFDWNLEWEVETEKPRILVLNTGAWDYDDIAREMNARFVNATDECLWANQTVISERRANAWVNSTIVHELADIGARHGVRLIYRNNHFNNRFGPTCADQRLEALMQGTHWEVWDNKRISANVWKSQTWDGFHFDRHKSMCFHACVICVFDS